MEGLKGEKMFKKPIALLLYARPNETSVIFDILKKISAVKIYVSLDYPKSDNCDLIYNNEMVKSIINSEESNFNIIKVFNNENLGPMRSYINLMEMVFQNEEEVIYLEDDNLPSLSFFYFCSNMLDKYRLDFRIRYISGMNRINDYPKDYEYDYFFSNLNTHWGHATWKRTYESMLDSVNYIESSYYKSLFNELRKQTLGKPNLNQISESLYHKSHFRGFPLSASFLLNSMTSSYISSSLVIIPKLNLVTDIGATKFTVHGDELKFLPFRVQKMYFRTNYEIDFPLKHPPFIVNDLIYLKKTYGLRNTFSDKLERVIRILLFKGPKELLRKTRIYLKRRMQR
jgi:hypothetical protein